MSELKKIVSSDSVFFNRVVLKPNVSEVFIKSVTAIDSNGTAISLSNIPFVLEDTVILKNKNKNAIAVEIIIEHPFITNGDDISRCVDIDVNRVSMSRTARIETKDVQVLNKGSLHIVSKMEDAESLIVSANVGIIGYGNDGRIILSEFVRMGLGNTRELISNGDKVDHTPTGIVRYKDGIVSKDKIEVKSGIIHEYDDSCLYIYKPDYLDKQKDISEDIAIDPSNSIIIKNKDVVRLECRLSADILDIDGSEPVIKYIGIISK
nr:MAG TPA: hypothetical protein [Caudoviricetes sp.]